MGENRRRKKDWATATLGLSGVAGAGALRHQALAESYREKTPHKVPRPKAPVPSELRLLRHPEGRAKYLTATGLSFAAIPAAATGVSNLMRPNDRKVRLVEASKRSFLEVGAEGVREAVHERNEGVRQRPPKKLVLGNYAAGAGITALTGGGIYQGLKRTKLKGTKREAMLASVGGVLAGSASLPVQAKLTRRYSHGRYTVTPTGVRRVETSKIAVRVHPESVRAGYGSVRSNKLSRAYVKHGATVGSHWTKHVSNLASEVEGYEPKYGKPKGLHKLIRTGRAKLGETLRTLSYDVSGIQDKDKLIREAGSGQGRLAKSLDPGAEMSRGQRRAVMSAAGTPPVVGDFLSAGAAGRLAPPGRRRRAAGETYAGSALGGFAGQAAGAGGALYAANKSPTFQRKATQASDVIDRGVARVRSGLGLPPKGKGLVQRLEESKRTPGSLKSGIKAVKATRVGQAVAKNPKVAAIGALAGGALGGMGGQQAAYSHVMRSDDRYRAKLAAGNFAKYANVGKPLSTREREQLARRKRANAAMLYFTGTTGLGSLGTSLASSKSSPLKAATKAKIGRATLPLLTAGAGVGGVNAYTGAKIQRREAANLAKAFGMGMPRTPRGSSMLRMPGIRPTTQKPPGAGRAPSMRRGFIRQTRYAGGQVRVSSVRGGLA